MKLVLKMFSNDVRKAELEIRRAAQKINNNLYREVSSYIKEIYNNIKSDYKINMGSGYKWTNLLNLQGRHELMMEFEYLEDKISKYQ